MGKQIAKVTCKNGNQSISTEIECTKETTDSEIIEQGKIKLSPKRGDYDLSKLFISERKESK